MADIPPLPDLTRLGRPGAPLLDLLRPGFDALIRTIWRTTVHGRENLPDGGAIVAVNHVGIFDGPLAVALTPRSQAMAKNELWRNAVLAKVLDALGQIPVDRWNADPGSMRRCIQALQAGRKLVIFPEGHRTPKEFEWFRGGAAYLALVTGKPVVPMALVGTAVGQTTGLASIPRLRQPITVTYGEPFEVTAQPWPRTPGQVADVGERLRELCLANLQRAQQLAGPELHRRTS